MFKNSTNFEIVNPHVKSIYYGTLYCHIRLHFSTINLEQE